MRIRHTLASTAFLSILTTSITSHHIANALHRRSTVPVRSLGLDASTRWLAHASFRSPSAIRTHPQRPRTNDSQRHFDLDNFPSVPDSAGFVLHLSTFSESSSYRHHVAINANGSSQAQGHGSDGWCFLRFSSSSVTPNARPRIVRAQHGYSSPHSQTTSPQPPTVPAPGTGRARVDLSAFASPSSAASSPAMSPSINGRPVSASSAVQVRSQPGYRHPRPPCVPLLHFIPDQAPTVGASTSSYRLAEARLEGPMDANLASLTLTRSSSTQRKRRFGSRLVLPLYLQVQESRKLAALIVHVRQVARAANRSVTIPQAHHACHIRPIGCTRFGSKASFATAISRKHRPGRHTTTEQVSVAEATSASPSIGGQGYFPQTSPPKPLPHTRNSEPIVPGRQASIPLLHLQLLETQMPQLAQSGERARRSCR